MTCSKNTLEIDSPYKEGRSWNTHVQHHLIFAKGGGGGGDDNRHQNRKSYLDSLYLGYGSKGQDEQKMLKQLGVS